MSNAPLDIILLVLLYCYTRKQINICYIKPIHKKEASMQIKRKGFCALLYFFFLLLFMHSLMRSKK